LHLCNITSQDNFQHGMEILLILKLTYDKIRRMFMLYFVIFGHVAKLERRLVSSGYVLRLACVSYLVRFISLGFGSTVRLCYISLTWVT